MALQSFLLGSMVPYVARTFLPLQAKGDRTTCVTKVGLKLEMMD